MSTTSIPHSSHDAMRAAFLDDDQVGRISPTARADLANGRARISAGPFNWDADLPGIVGGGNQAPSPTAYLLGALASCAVAYTHDTLAPEFGVTIEQLSAVASCATDLAGLVGVDGRDPRLAGLTLEITVVADPADRVEELQAAWLARCPVYLALTEPSRVAVRWTAG